MVPLKVVIAGGRDFNDYYTLEKWADRMLSEVRKNHQIIILYGCAMGADELGRRYAQNRGYPNIPFPAEWEKYKRPNGKNPAGMIRNKQMINDADLLLAAWDGVSSGTYNAIENALDKGICVRVLRYAPNNYFAGYNDGQQEGI